MPPNIILAFDAYGTLLSTDSIATKLAAHFGADKAATIATTWRKYQLEYTWRANSMGVYHDFSLLTRRSLRHALAEAGVSLDDAQVEQMMQAYDNLSTFPDVEPLLQELRKANDVKAVIFSNGTEKMVSSSVSSSPDLGRHGELFSSIVSVDSIRKFKPAPESYQHLAEEVGKDPLKAEQMAQIWLISGNPFDIVGGRAVGMNAIWIDRAGTGWLDALQPRDSGRPSAVVRGLGEVVGVVRGAMDK